VPALRGRAYATIVTFPFALAAVRRRHDVVHAQGWTALRADVVTAHIVLGAWRQAAARAGVRPPTGERLLGGWVEGRERGLLSRARRVIGLIVRLALIVAILGAAGYGAYLYLPTASITVNWPTKAGDPVSGGILLTYRGWDDRAAEQTVYLTGTPAKVGGWLWRVSCPETRQQVPALYLAPDGDRFLSREATGLKYRRANSKADRALRRCFKLMQKLQTDHCGPGIGKPPGMSDRVFDKLEWQLKKEDIRYMCAVLGKADPEFHDEEPAPPPQHAARQPQRSMVRDPSVYYRDKSGTLKMRAKFEKKFGLATSTHRKRPPFQAAFFRYD